MNYIHFSSRHFTIYQFTSLHFPSCPTLLILLHLITNVQFCRTYKKLCPSLWYFLQSPVTHFHLGPNTSLSALFSIILTAYSFFNVRDQVSHNIFWDIHTYWRWHSVQSSEVTSVKVISLVHFPKHNPTPVSSFRSHEYGVVSPSLATPLEDWLT
jgi:hypothetical protein